ncbi:nucleotide kinase domain-containing protein [Leifsonia sp. NPDC102414]|uniref:nucleotide kinase domain-containing protein n=1 Tax=Leifsonia sp. NPDC102414 TaxID=3364124 RepID=UPI0038075BF0
MMADPRPRSNVYEIFWRFAAERQRIYDARIAGLPGPWTEDRILQTYKFCNTYRAADRVSQALIRDVIYTDEPTAPADLAFQIVLFRTFSNINTWRFLLAHFGRKPRISDLTDGSLEACLNMIREINGRLYTGAFILCATDAYGRRIKHLNHVELFRHMFVLGDLSEKLAAARSLAEVYAELHTYPLMGDFMSYQIAIDLNYSELTSFSENDFTQPGPGALRGIKKVFEDLGPRTPQDVILWMVDQQEAAFARYEIDFNGLFGRPLQAIDVQNLFCETDKYCREAVPALTSARSKIKAKFTPATDPIPVFFPPKWGLNTEARLPALTTA